MDRTEGNQGAWTGDVKPVRLSHLYKGGKLCDMPLYNKASDVNPRVELEKRTVTQMIIRDSCR